MKRTRIQIFCRNGVDAAEKILRARAYCDRRRSRVRLVGETIENSVKQSAARRLISVYERERGFDLLLVPALPDIAADLRSVIEVLDRMSKAGIRVRFIEPELNFTPQMAKLCDLIQHSVKNWKREKIRLSFELAAYLNQKLKMEKPIGRPVKLTEEKRRIIEKMLKEGLTIQEIVRATGVSQTSVKRVRRSMR